jgi:hypothetical protein
MAPYRKGPPVRPLVFKTPGRECAHATKGCCPKCFDPCRLLGRKIERKK